MVSMVPLRLNVVGTSRSSRRSSCGRMLECLAATDGRRSDPSRAASQRGIIEGEDIESLLDRRKGCTGTRGGQPLHASVQDDSQGDKSPGAVREESAA